MTDRLIDATYVDAFGETRAVSPAVRRAVRAAMGLAPRGADAAGTPVVVARRGGPVPARAEVVLEDGTELGALRRLPRDIPYGYHRLRGRAAERPLLVGPGRCHLPDVREWGWAVQLASLRSARSWGIGDFDDLGALARWSAGRGAGFVAVSPLGAPNPAPDPQPSPYYPSTRRFLNPLHLAITGPMAAGADVGALRRLADDRRIDRATVLRLKMGALERAWADRHVDRDALDAFRAERGPSLERWAIFTILSERLGAGWQAWPAEYRRPDSDAVRAIAATDPGRVAFHCWIQLQLDAQLAEASRGVRRIADMPVGVDPGGFDAWEWQEQHALDASVGAPPDRFNTAGQDWGLPPLVPHRLREAGYGPFIETIRAQLRHAGGLRVDHVLGLFRLWWIPSGSGPADGAYVRYPTHELLEVLAIESERAGAIVIGEDLGTVPPGVRQELRRRRILSTRLALFERGRPDRYPRRAFAAVTTHDLPTISGIWSGADVRDQAAAGISADADANEQLRRQLSRVAGLGPEAVVDDVTLALHARLAASPSMLVAATLEDALGVQERPNLPGTVGDQRANWSVALPAPIESIRRSRRVRRLAEALRR